MQRKKTERPQIVVACTCRAVNHGWIKERRLYNLPLPKCGKLAFHENVGGIVVFVEAHPNLAFKARFKDVVDGAWLAKNGYSLAVKPHGEKYALYELYEESTPAKLLGAKSAEVFVSSARCPCVKIDEAFYSKPYPVTGGRSMPHVFDCLKPYVRKWKSATTFNPVQGDFFRDNYGFDYGLQVARGIVDSAKKHGALTGVEICAGAGGQAVGRDRAESKHVALS